MTVLERNLEASAEEAVKSAEALRSFRAYLRGLLDGGLVPQKLEEALEVAYEHAREGQNEPVADLIADGLDLVIGWCAPEARIAESSAA